VPRGHDEPDRLHCLSHAFEVFLCAREGDVGIVVLMYKEAIINVQVKSTLVVTQKHTFPPNRRFVEYDSANGRIGGDLL
jgi:hypothetical protein